MRNLHLIVVQVHSNMYTKLYVMYTQIYSTASYVISKIYGKHEQIHPSIHLATS